MWHGAPRLTLEIKGSGPGGKTDLTVMGSITCMLTCFQIGVTKSASESQAVTLRLLLVATNPGPDRDGQGPGLPGGSGARAGPVQHRAAVAGKAGRPRWPPRPPQQIKREGQIRYVPAWVVLLTVVGNKTKVNRRSRTKNFWRAIACLALRDI